MKVTPDVITQLIREEILKMDTARHPINEIKIPPVRKFDVDKRSMPYARSAYGAESDYKRAWAAWENKEKERQNKTYKELKPRVLAAKLAPMEDEERLIWLIRRWRNKYWGNDPFRAKVEDDQKVLAAAKVAIKQMEEGAVSDGVGWRMTGTDKFKDGKPGEAQKAGGDFAAAMDAASASGTVPTQAAEKTKAAAQGGGDSGAMDIMSLQRAYEQAMQTAANNQKMANDYKKAYEIFKSKYEELLAQQQQQAPAKKKGWFG